MAQHRVQLCSSLPNEHELEREEPCWDKSLVPGVSRTPIPLPPTPPQSRSLVECVTGSLLWDRGGSSVWDFSAGEGRGRGKGVKGWQGTLPHTPAAVPSFPWCHFTPMALAAAALCPRPEGLGVWARGYLGTGRCCCREHRSPARLSLSARSSRLLGERSRVPRDPKQGSQPCPGPALPGHPRGWDEEVSFPGWASEWGLRAAPRRAEPQAGPREQQRWGKQLGLGTQGR